MLQAPLRSPAIFNPRSEGRAVRCAGGRQYHRKRSREQARVCSYSSRGRLLRDDPGDPIRCVLTATNPSAVPPCARGQTTPRSESTEYHAVGPELMMCTMSTPKCETRGLMAGNGRRPATRSGGSGILGSRKVAPLEALGRRLEACGKSYGEPLGSLGKRLASAWKPLGGLGRLWGHP